MNIYLVERIDDWGYDEYNAFVVIADNEKTALHTHPNGSILSFNEEYCSSWTNSPIHLKVTLIGIAVEGSTPGVVLRSFNAG